MACLEITGRVEIAPNDGRLLSAAVQHAKGDLRNPLSQDEVIAKHRSTVAGIVDRRTNNAAIPAFILGLKTKPVDLYQCVSRIRLLWLVIGCCAGTRRMHSETGRIPLSGGMTASLGYPQHRKDRPHGPCR